MDGLYRVQERGKESELKKEEAEERERERGKNGEWWTIETLGWNGHTVVGQPVPGDQQSVAGHYEESEARRRVKTSRRGNAS